MSTKPSFFAELKRRNVYKVGAMYAVGGWLVVQIVTQVLPIFHISDVVQRIVVLAIVAGFPVALVLSWIYELTPQGIVKTDEVTPDASITRHTGQRLNRSIIGVLVIAVLFMAAKIFWPRGDMPATATPPAPIAAGDKSIAVLPFVNMSGEAANEYFSDGITEEILNAASQLPGLRVVARTSAFQFKGKNVDLRKVGETLDVAYVLEGSVQRSGDEVRITAQLIDAHSGYHRWSAKFDRKLTNVFSIEDEIATAIVAQLQLQLDDKRQGPLVKQGTENPQAHELYLKGLADITKRGPPLATAAQLFEQAVALDPNYAAAWGGLAQTYELLPWYQLGEWSESLDKARAAAEKALALDDTVASAHNALATIFRDRADYAAADKAYHRALELDPGSAETHDQYAQYLYLLGQWETGIDEERKALALDPLAPNPQLQLGLGLIVLHRYDEALAQTSAALAREPDNHLLNFQLTFLDIHLGNFSAAEPLARKAATLAGNDPEIAGALVRAAADPSLRPAALHRLEASGPDQPSLGTAPRAIWYCLLGDRAAALREHERWAAIVSRPGVIAGSFFFGFPAFDLIRDDLRFQAVLKKVGLPVTPIESAPK